MTLATTSITGFALLRLLASLKRWRRSSLRFAQEQQAIEAWLGALRHVLPRHPEFAAALVQAPRLRKGYSDTMTHGVANYERIFDALVQPWVEHAAAPDDAAAKSLRQAIDAALADPQARQLERALASAPQPIVFRPRERPPTPTAPSAPV
jgi:indolepyruvate ferredoxin oxidoreductase beta subunit